MVRLQRRVDSEVQNILRTLFLPLSSALFCSGVELILKEAPSIQWWRKPPVPPTIQNLPSHRPQGNCLALWLVLLWCFILDNFSTPVDGPINTFLISRNKSHHLTSAIYFLEPWPSSEKQARYPPLQTPHPTFQLFCSDLHTCNSLCLLQNLFVLVLSHCPITTFCPYSPLCLITFHSPFPFMYLRLLCMSFWPSYSPGHSQAR